MAETLTVNPRPDVDIENDIMVKVVRPYAPLANDRHHVHFSVVNGRVTVSGHVKAPMTRRYLLSKLERLPSVINVSASELYDDETIRLQAGKLVPSGVQVTSNYGIVILAGAPEGISASEIARRIVEIPGVKQVVSAFE